MTRSCSEAADAFLFAFFFLLVLDVLSTARVETQTVEASPRPMVASRDDGSGYRVCFRNNRDPFQFSH